MRSSCARSSYVDGLADAERADRRRRRLQRDVERSRTLLDVATPEWGFSQAGPGHRPRPRPRPRVSVRPDALARSDAPRAHGALCPTTRPWTSSSNDVRGGARAVPRARARRVPQRRHVRAARARDGRTRWPSSCAATWSRAAAASRTSTRCSPARAECASVVAALLRHDSGPHRADVLDDRRLQHRARRARPRPGRRDRHDRRRALRPCGARLRVRRPRARRTAVRTLGRSEALDAIVAEVTPRTRLLAVSHVLWTTGGHARRARAEGAHRAAGPRRRRAVGRRDPRRRRRARLLHRVRAEVALRPRQRPARSTSRDPEALRVATPELLRAGVVRARRRATSPREGAVASTRAGSSSRRSARARDRARPRARLALRADRGDGRALPRGACRARASRHAAGQAGLVTFRPDGDPEEHGARLFEQGVVVRDIPGTPWVRASCGWWTSDEERPLERARHRRCFRAVSATWR